MKSTIRKLFLNQWSETRREPNFKESCGRVAWVQGSQMNISHDEKTGEDIRILYFADSTLKLSSTLMLLSVNMEWASFQVPTTWSIPSLLSGDPMLLGQLSWKQFLYVNVSTCVVHCLIRRTEFNLCSYGLAKLVSNVINEIKLDGKIAWQRDKSYIPKKTKKSVHRKCLEEHSALNQMMHFYIY